MHDLIYPRYVPASAYNAIREAPGTWQEWKDTWTAMADPDYELLSEDFAALFAMYRKLQRLGVMFDVVVDDWMDRISHSMTGREDDGDYDQSDDRLDREDGDEDASDQWMEDHYGCRPKCLERDEEDPRWWHGVTVTNAVRPGFGGVIGIKSTARGEGVSL